jgi:hypothetical protein
MQDVVKAVRDFLLADAGVQAILSPTAADVRVFGIELPQAEAAEMPRKAIVIKRISGAGGLGGRLQLESGYLDLVCYGETPLEASRLRGAVRDALRECIRVVVDQTLLHSFEPATAPTTQTGAGHQVAGRSSRTGTFLASEVASRIKRTHHEKTHEQAAVPRWCAGLIADPDAVTGAGFDTVTMTVQQSRARPASRIDAARTAGLSTSTRTSSGTPAARCCSS